MTMLETSSTEPSSSLFSDYRRNKSQTWSAASFGSILPMLKELDGYEQASGQKREVLSSLPPKERTRRSSTLVSLSQLPSIDDTNIWTSSTAVDNGSGSGHRNSILKPRLKTTDDFTTRRKRNHKRCVTFSGEINASDMNYSDWLTTVSKTLSTEIEEQKKAPIEPTPKLNDSFDSYDSFDSAISKKNSFEESGSLLDNSFTNPQSPQQIQQDQMFRAQQQMQQPFGFQQQQQPSPFGFQPPPMNNMQYSNPAALQQYFQQQWVWMHQQQQEMLNKMMNMNQQQQQQQQPIMAPQSPVQTPLNAGNQSPVAGGVAQPPSILSKNIILGDNECLNNYKLTGNVPLLDDLVDNIIEFAKDVHGSRILQYLMETSNLDDKQKIHIALLPYITDLCYDQFGNYVVQNILKHTNYQQRKEILNEMKTSMVPISITSHGCRVLQGLIDTVADEDLLNIAFLELCSSSDIILNGCLSTYATHVYQKMIIMLVNKTDLNVDSLTCLSNIEMCVSVHYMQMCLHPLGYRVVLNLIGTNDYRKQSTWIYQFLQNMSENNALTLATHQHGNFLLQHFIDYGSVQNASLVQNFVCTHIKLLSQHKFGSHLVEKCLAHASAEQLETFIMNLINKNIENNKNKNNSVDDDLLCLMKDKFGNFVVQKAYKCASGKLRNTLLVEIMKYKDVLSMFTYGKHILSMIEKTKK